ncbi:MAG: ATP-binding cassette domain-containing protein [Propionibacteriaceae bacterium]|jgi:ABC-type oligopeptide transport system ATPase subunit|nr:ATP-binding cassette domain-containing protein [Propionibacteriaceae bacterium]
MASADSVILETRGLRKVFRGGSGFSLKRHDVVAVADANLTVEKGKTLAVVGESGSGKSTLARLILRLIEPSAGEVLFRGTDLKSLSGKELRAQRRHLQMVFQDPYASLHPRRSVAGIISEGWRIHSGLVEPKDYQRRVDELLEQVGLPLAYADVFPSRLSGGERQRVAIARALALRPEVLILDEPVSALDVSIQAQVIKLIKSLQEELGLTFVFISHDLALVRLVSDDVLVMKRGEIIEQGVTSEVYDHPRAEYTKTLLASAPGHLVAAMDAAEATKDQTEAASLSEQPEAVLTTTTKD